MTEKILLVDDERDIVDLLEEVLRKEGFRSIETALTGSEAIGLCREYQPDVVVLDVMLPDIDGIEVCRCLREFSHCSILFLSSRDDDVDKILGLSAGGDDYVTKPFSPREIVFRIKSQLRRMQFARADAGMGVAGEGVDAAGESVVTVGDITVDTASLLAYKAGVPLELTAKEYGLLRFFAENPGKIISKERLYEQVWGEEGFACDNTVMVHIRHLREKIEMEPSSPRRIVTVKGLGYKLIDGDPC